MVANSITVYSDQALSPRAVEVISAMKKDAGYGDTKFMFFDPNKAVENNTLLVFGNALPLGVDSGVKVINTYSVAQLMTKANAATVFASSLRLASTQVVYPTLTPEWLWPIDNINRIDWDFDAPVAIDIETNGNLKTTHTTDEVQVISVALYQEGRPPVVFAHTRPTLDSPAIPLTNIAIARLRELLPKFKKPVYHNGKFDTRVLNRVLGVKLTVWFDTMLAHHVLNMAARQHGLKELARLYFGAEDWEADIKRYVGGKKNYDSIPREKLIYYNGMDVFWTMELFKLLSPQIEMDENNTKAFMLEMAAADMLLGVEVTGLPIDNEAADELAATSSVEMLRHRKQLEHLTGDREFNPNSPKQVKEALAKLGVRVNSTSTGVLEPMLEDPDTPPWVTKFVENLLAFRKASKVKGTYAEGWKSRSRNGRVHPTFLVHGTTTGRLSSTNPNAQNMPRDKGPRRIVGV